MQRRQDMTEIQQCAWHRLDVQCTPAHLGRPSLSTQCKAHKSRRGRYRSDWECSRTDEMTPRVYIIKRRTSGWKAPGNVCWQNVRMPRVWSTTPVAPAGGGLCGDPKDTKRSTPVVPKSCKYTRPSQPPACKSVGAFLSIFGQAIFHPDVAGSWLPDPVRAHSLVIL